MATNMDGVSVMVNIAAYALEKKIVNGHVCGSDGVEDGDDAC